MDIVLEESRKILDHKEIWKQCLREIKENVSLITYNTWFLPIKPVEVEGATLKIQVPNDFFVEWIDEHYCSLINSVIEKVIGNEGKLIYIVVEEQEELSDPIISQPVQAPKVEKVKKITPHQLIKDKSIDSHLNPRYKFDNFIKGESNQLARAAAIAISENPGQTSFNPFFIYGGVGLGKTHLIQAIGNQIAMNNPHKKTIYLSTDTFTVEFVEAIQNDSINQFANFYKSMDVLIIDDIQFLIGKEKTQDLFFQIFNILHQSGKQIILSSDKPPKELKGLNERLISRFQWGLSADIQPPDFETRIAILKDKSESFGINLSNQILEYIAHNITSNIRELEGCLVRILANSTLTSQDITFDTVKRTVKEISTSRQPKNISIDFITKEVCEFYSVDENSVREKNRKKEVVMARQIAMYLSKKLTNSSLKTIGLHFGGRDHSTVIHAFNSIDQQIANNQTFKETLEEIRNKIELSAA